MLWRKFLNKKLKRIISGKNGNISFGMVYERQYQNNNIMAEVKKQVTAALEDLCIDTVRVLAADAVQKANSGHPGTPMGLAPVGHVLWTKSMRYNPLNPEWPNRDRFVLSAGHACMLQYSFLHLTGYDITLNDIKKFRQLHSKTAGHPEYGLLAGIEVTTGPLGQGFANGVGMAIAQQYLAARYNKPGFNLFDYRIYSICSDGDMMEGVTSEAASIAGWRESPRYFPTAATSGAAMPNYCMP